MPAPSTRRSTRAVRRVGLLALSLVALLSASTPAHAHGGFPGGVHFPTPKYGLSVGGSLAVFTGEGILGPMVTVDVTGAHYFGWYSLGLRAAFDNDSTYLMPYLEAGGCFLLCAGVGYTLGAAVGPGAPIARNNVHVYLGLPIPIKLDWEDGFFMLTPYYRPTRGVGGEPRRWTHEAGLLFKWAIGKKAH